MVLTMIDAIIKIPTGGFYVHDTKNLHIIPYSSNAFGSCYFLMQDKTSHKMLIAHVNSATVMLKPVANKTIKKMILEFEKKGGDIKNSQLLIIHSNNISEYEQAFSSIARDKLTVEEGDSKLHYSTFIKEDEEKAIAEPFSIDFLIQSLVNAGIDITECKINSDFDSNLVEYIENSEVEPEKTNILIKGSRIFLQNTKHKKYVKGERESFDKLRHMLLKTNTKIYKPKRHDFEIFYKLLAKGLKGENNWVTQNANKLFEFTKKAPKAYLQRIEEGDFSIINVNNTIDRYLKKFTPSLDLDAEVKPKLKREEVANLSR